MESITTLDHTTMLLLLAAGVALLLIGRLTRPKGAGFSLRQRGTIIGSHNRVNQRADIGNGGANGSGAGLALLADLLTVAGFVLTVGGLAGLIG